MGFSDCSVVLSPPNRSIFLITILTASFRCSNTLHRMRNIEMTIVGHFLSKLVWLIPKRSVLHTWGLICARILLRTSCMWKVLDDDVDSNQMDSFMKYIHQGVWYFLPSVLRGDILFTSYYRFMVAISLLMPNSRKKNWSHVEKWMYSQNEQQNNYMPDWARPHRLCACTFPRCIHISSTIFRQTLISLAKAFLLSFNVCQMFLILPFVFRMQRSERNTFIIFSPLRTNWRSRDKMLCASACLKFTWCDIVGSRWRVADE